VIFVEFQTGSFRLVQEAYDCFGWDYSDAHPRNVQVQACTGCDLGECVYMPEGEKDSLLTGVVSRDLCTDQLVGDGGASRVAVKRFRAELGRINGAGTYDNIMGDLAQKVWRGWFEEPYGEWKPVLFADDGCKRAVLLKRKGYLLSTILVSSPLFKAGETIVENALNLSRISDCQPSVFEKQFPFVRRFVFAAVIGTIVATGLGYALGPTKLIQALLTGFGSGVAVCIFQRLPPRLIGSGRSRTEVKEADTKDKTDLV